MPLTIEEKNGLLQEVKAYLRITWIEEDADLIKMIERALGYFYSITLTDLDFVDDLQNRQLLLDRCRYMRNHATEEFEKNFMSELNNFQMRTLPESSVVDGTI